MKLLKINCIPVVSIERKFQGIDLEVLERKLAQSSSFQWHVSDIGFFACIELRDNVNIDKLTHVLDEKNIKIDSISENYIDTYSSDKILKLSVSKPNLNNIKHGISIILGEFSKL